MAKAAQKIYQCKYQLTIHNVKKTRQIDELTATDSTIDKRTLRMFNRPQIQKIYVISDIKGTVLYVGSTLSPIRTTLNQGLKSDGRNRYYGFKWKDKNKVVVYAWCISDITDVMAARIRGEMVYLIRKKTGKWPLYQNELRISNLFPDGAAIAEKLLRDLDI